MKENCLLCKKQLDESEVLHLLHLHQVKCCDRCAGKVSKAYQEWHGGPVSNRKPAYKKQKITAKLSLSVFEKDGYQCLKCGAKKDLTVDHIYPESKGGPSTKENMQTLCRSCNSRKGVKNAVV